MSDKELMDAVSAAIDGAGGQPAPAGDHDDAGTDTTDAGAADGTGAEQEAAQGDDKDGTGDPADRAAAGDGAGEAADGDGGTATGAESGGPERDPKTGKFVAKKPDGEGADPAAAAAKPGAQPGTPKPGAKPVAAPKPPDHVNDPIPEEVKGKTRERMQGLITAAKTLTTERDTLKQERDELLETIQATGAEPETFWRHTEVLRLMLSDDANDQRNAVKHLRGAADKIAAQLGDPVPGHDPLKDPANKDLAEEVEAGDLSRERALELAQARSRTAAEGRRTTETEAQRQAREQHETAVEAARGELNTLGETLKKANPTLYATKAAILLPAVKEMVKHTPPSQWATAYKAMYDKLNVAAPAAKPGNRAPRGTGTNQPARPTQGAGGGGPRVPQNELEALDLGIAAAAQVQR